ALARVAEAAGAAGLALSAGTAHPNHPRALRASAGSLLRLPVAVNADPDALSRHLAALQPRWAALVPRDGVDLYHAPLDGTLILAVGAEGPGLSAALTARAALRLTIPMEPPVESLNATVAAALVLFEARRRRSKPGGNGHP
ncbi:MAG TPA: TrmH family RNA methyltransferase, partial [Thermoanaerobaculia bacterium]